MSDINEVFSDDDFFAETTTKKEVLLNVISNQTRLEGLSKQNCPR